MQKQCRRCSLEKDSSEFGAAAANKDGLKSYCHSCLAAKTREWRAANPEAYRAKKKRNYRKHPETQKAARQRRYEHNRDTILARNRAYAATHADQLRLAKAKNHIANGGRDNARTRQWKRDNPEQVQLLNLRRRAWKLRAKGDCSLADWLALCDRYDNRCLACAERKPLTVDHVVPLVRGGLHDISNIQPLCKPCNSAKGRRIIDYRSH